MGDPGRRVVVVRTSPHVPPGQLSWPAWQALHRGVVLVGDAAHPQLPALRAAGVAVRVLAAGPDRAERVASAAPAVWLAGPGEEDLPVALPGVSVEVVVGSSDPPGARLLDVVAVMDRLRGPGGCPWDAAQSFRSLMPYLLEEAYEAYAALEDDDPVGLREELGDVLLQVAFHARLAQELPEGQRWGIDEVAGDLVDKLVRRHPHVFAGAAADDLERSWEAQKAAEKGRTSVTEGVPLGQPALSLAAKLQRRATRLGAPVPAYEGLGGELWALVARCRLEGVDAEAALRTVARAFRDRLAEVERSVRAEGADPAALTPQEWDARWS